MVLGVVSDSPSLPVSGSPSRTGHRRSPSSAPVIHCNRGCIDCRAGALGAPDLPTPPTPRASVWRKLRRLGVAQLADGLVALPEDARTREQLEWIAEEVLGAGGTAMLWLAEPTVLADERSVTQDMSEHRTREYDDLASRATTALHGTPAERRRALKSLRGELRGVRRRDYFRAPGREAAQSAIDALASAVADPAEAGRRASR